jgi:AcrR family transcriptional regulator
LLAALDAAAATAPRDVDALAAMFDAHVGFVVDHPGVPRLIFHALQDPADTDAKTEVRALLQAYRQRLLQHLASAAARGELRAGIDPAAAAMLFVGTVQGLVMQAMSAGAVAGIAGQAGVVFALYRRALVEAA